MVVLEPYKVEVLLEVPHMVQELQGPVLGQGLQKPQVLAQPVQLVVVHLYPALEQVVVETVLEAVSELHCNRERQLNL